MMKKYSLLILYLFISNVLKAQIVRDYRNFQSPVKSQHNRGTCTGFALMACMETLPGFPTDLSEQFAYGLTKLNKYTPTQKASSIREGADLKDYIQVLSDIGTIREDMMPYNPYLGFIEDAVASTASKIYSDIGVDDTDFKKFYTQQPFCYKLDKDQYEYLPGSDAQDVAWIKRQLDNGVRAVAVGYFLNAEQWSAHRGLRFNKIDMDEIMQVQLTGNWVKYSFANKLILNLSTKIKSGEIKARYTDAKYSKTGGHAVTIVGYDESGFIIKNSWGRNWGDNGYGWVSFNYHQYYADEAIAIKNGSFAITKNSLFNWTLNDLYLKSLPQNNLESDLNISLVFHGDGMPPKLKSITYQVYDKNEKLVQTINGISILTYLSFNPYEHGYPTKISNYVTIIDNKAGLKIVATIETEMGFKYTNTYYHVVAKNKEYMPGDY